MSDDENSNEFEFSGELDGNNKKDKGPKYFEDKPYDEALEFSQDQSLDLSMAESFDFRDKRDDVKQSEGDKKPKNTKKFEDKPYDEALEFSQEQSFAEEQGTTPPKKAAETNSNDTKPLLKRVSYDNHDEEWIVDSTSDESIDSKLGNTRSEQAKQSNDAKPTKQTNSNNLKAFPDSDDKRKENPKEKASDTLMSNYTSLEDSDDGDTSYSNIEGAYNPADFSHLKVSSEVRDLFQYIERFKPHDIELMETNFKCFIPDYIPAIGMVDSFLKVPRPDNKDEDLGIKMLDEPSAIQSDPTVLEMQLRSSSKKLQYGEVAVRSIENASKSPAAIEKWIQNVTELHRTKPLPQVNYKKSMPEIEKLMEVWPEDFEAALRNLQLPSPELDLSLLEYTKTLCAILDIPVYENPIESLHLMFSLYMDFRNNPHFQARNGNGNADSKGNYEDGADVLEIASEYK